MKEYYVYIVSSITWTLYIGMTNNLKRRIYEHKNSLIDWFTKKYRCHKLVYYEVWNEVEYVIKREKQIKKWNRSKKETLISSFNSGWVDLYDDIIYYISHKLEMTVLML